MCKRIILIIFSLFICLSCRTVKPSLQKLPSSKKMKNTEIVKIQAFSRKLPSDKHISDKHTSMATKHSLSTIQPQIKKIKKDWKENEDIASESSQISEERCKDKTDDIVFKYPFGYIMISKAIRVIFFSVIILFCLTCCQLIFAIILLITAFVKR